MLPADPAPSVNPSASTKRATNGCIVLFARLFFSPVSSILANTPAPPFVLISALTSPPRAVLSASHGLLGPARVPAYLRSASAPRRRRVFPARAPQHRVPGPVGPGRIFKSSGRRWPRWRRARAGSSSRAGVAGSGCSGPGLALQVKWTSRAPDAPAPGRVFKSSGRRGLRLFRARISSPSRADVVGADASASD